MQFLWVDAYVNAPKGLNFRRSAGLDRTIIAVIPDRAAIQVCEQVQDNADKTDWIMAIYGDRIGFVAKSLVTLGAAPPIPTPKKQLYCGLHVGGNGDYGQLLPTLRTFHELGSPIPAVLVVSDPGLCRTIKETSPNTLVIYRWVAGEADPIPFSSLNDNGAGSLGSGAAWFDELYKRHSQAVPYADLHQLYNEASFGENKQNTVYAQRVGTFDLEMMQRADEIGIKVTIGNYMPGVPEPRHLEMMHPALAYAQAHGHWFLYHAYDSPVENNGFFTINKDGVSTVKFFGLRNKEWLDQFYPRLNVLSGETAHFQAPRYRNEADFAKVLREIQAMGEIANTPLRRWVFCYWLIKGQTHRLWKADDVTPQLPTVYTPVQKSIAGVV